MVLFGDSKDVSIKNVGIAPILSSRDSFEYELNPSSEAFISNFRKARVHINEKSFFYIVHHEGLNGYRLAKAIVGWKGYSDHTKRNVFSRYDWCHYNYWGEDVYGNEEKQHECDENE